MSSFSVSRIAFSAWKTLHAERSPLCIVQSAYSNPRIARWMKAYRVQADVGVHRAVIVGRGCSEHLPEFVLFHLKKDNTIRHGAQ